jgi:hypothetical protein
MSAPLEAFAAGETNELPIQATTVHGVRLKYAAEDAIRLAADLAKCELFTCSEQVRAVALVAWEALLEEEGARCGDAPLFSVRV